LPFTTGWWCLFLVSLWQGRGGPWFRDADSDIGKQAMMLEGMACCCGLTTALGFYGAQLLAPYAFPALLRYWVLRPADRYLPPVLAKPLLQWSETSSFKAFARFGDCLVHL
ncbi:unnamed protein product, partial [Polarella glacialis]